MKPLFYALILACFLNGSFAHAANESTRAKKEPTPAQKMQREKMKSCNQEAREKALKGDERKVFMKTCLSTGQAAESTKDTDKAKTCRQEAKDQKLKGDRRKAYIKNCLSA